MGICNSCESISVATAKLILQNGQLQEFSKPIKVSHALQMMNVSPMHFICDSDYMEFGGFFSAVDGDEVLQLGQLYFVLPLSWLKKPLRPEQMAALAVRASLALTNMRRRYGGGCKSASPVVFTISRMADRGGGDSGISDGVGHREVVRRRRRGGRRYNRRGGSGSYRTRLSVILEEDEKIEEGA
ncbi:hypothetical protein PS2_003087 [Malus domestica]|uniref:Uncharacterized protein n=1 Tax=Malus domestica TaxID=3750 RepID=A0A498IYL6_MALDO|nr:hypothetical protein DVH24_042267 [Malus domestica]